jgi:transcriptional regulator with GAF, ATPase, and Fis domain
MRNDHGLIQGREMSNAVTWKAKERSSSNGIQARIQLWETIVDNRIDTLRDLALTVLKEVESLRSAHPRRADGRVSLYDEVQRFEIDLIRSALERTGGNQAHAARLLGVKHTTLNAKIKRFKISSIGRETETHNDIQNQEIVA